MSWKSLKHLQRFIPFIAIGFLVLALVFARHQLTLYHISHIGRLILSVPPVTAAEVLALTCCGYAWLTCYDRVALWYIGKALPVRQSMLAAFVGFAISHNAGHPLVSGTSVRYRFYHAWGLTIADIIKITVMDSITYGLGLVSLLLVAYLLMQVTDIGPLPFSSLNVITALFALAYGVYWFCVMWWKPSITVKGVSLSLPQGRVTLVQSIVGSIDVIISGTVLYILLADHLSIPLSEFFIIYVLALVLAMVSQVPGGLGVFEGVFLKLFPDNFSNADILASLVLYRICYYFLPLAVGGLMLLAHEFKSNKLGLRYRIFKRYHYH